MAGSAICITLSLSGGSRDRHAYVLAAPHGLLHLEGGVAWYRTRGVVRCPASPHAFGRGHSANLQKITCSTKNELNAPPHCCSRSSSRLGVHSLGCVRVSRHHIDGVAGASSAGTKSGSSALLGPAPWSCVGGPCIAPVTKTLFPSKSATPATPLDCVAI